MMQMLVLNAMSKFMTNLLRSGSHVEVNGMVRMLSGQLVSLRTPIMMDSQHYFKWINDRELVLLNADYKPVSLEDHERWFNHLSMRSDVVTFSIIENNTNTLIGSCSLRNINAVHKNAELQIRIGEYAYHNKGYGSESVRLLVEYAFNELNLKRVYLYVFNTNRRAIRAYEKCNFHIEGLLKKAAFINGDFVDINVMAIINDFTPSCSLV